MVPSGSNEPLSTAAAATAAWQLAPALVITFRQMAIGVAFVALTVAVVVAEVLPRFESATAEATIAVSVSIPEAVGLRVIVTTRLEPAAIAPRSQVTVPPELV